MIQHKKLYLIRKKLIKIESSLNGTRKALRDVTGHGIVLGMHLLLDADTTSITGVLLDIMFDAHKKSLLGRLHHMVPLSTFKGSCTLPLKCFSL